MFLGVVANSCEVIHRWLCPANPHLAGKPAVNQFADLLVIDQFAMVGGGQPNLHLTHEPFVMLNKALDRLLGKRLRITPSLGSDPVEFGLCFRV